MRGNSRAWRLDLAPTRRPTCHQLSRAHFAWIAPDEMSVRLDEWLNLIVPRFKLGHVRPEADDGRRREPGVQAAAVWMFGRSSCRSNEGGRWVGIG